MGWKPLLNRELGLTNRPREVQVQFGGVWGRMAQRLEAQNERALHNARQGPDSVCSHRGRREGAVGMTIRGGSIRVLACSSGFRS